LSREISTDGKELGMTASVGKRPKHDWRFPSESDQYRQAREELLDAEVDLRRQIEAVAALRRKLPLGGLVPTDYEFEEWDTRSNAPRKVRMSELFADGKDSLFVYSHMFIPGKAGLPLEEACPSCTSIIDANDGEAQHIAQRINFVVVAKVPIEQFRAHAISRGWRHARLLSSRNNTYNLDYRAESPEGDQLPMATVFVRRNGKIYHTWSSELFLVPNDPGLDMRHVDFMWPLWSVLDTTPEGRGTDWGAELDYSVKK
jgi:predicted dithiol-disulfide oxidoreductase (DUF899 family)